jgi:hypothetical protein
MGHPNWMAQFHACKYVPVRLEDAHQVIEQGWPELLELLDQHLEVVLWHVGDVGRRRGVN